MKAKKNSNQQGKVWARRGQYENALTKTDIRNRPLELSWVDIDLGVEGETITKRIYFREMPAALGLKLRDKTVPLDEKLELMFDLLSSLILDPETAEPVMTAEEWGQEDFSFINKVSGTVLGMQFIADQAEDVEDEDNAQGADSEAQADPNPFVGTDG